HTKGSSKSHPFVASYTATLILPPVYPVIVISCISLVAVNSNQTSFCGDDHVSQPCSKPVVKDESTKVPSTVSTHSPSLTGAVMASSHSSLSGAESVLTQISNSDSGPPQVLVINTLM